MKYTHAAGVGSIGLWLLFSAADASSSYRNPQRGNTARPVRSSRSRRRTRSVVHDDNDDDDDFHRSLSSANWEGGSGHSSSPSLNENWDMEESSSYSSFYDFDDLKAYKKTKTRKTKDVDETERILRDLERRSMEEDGQIERPKRSRRKKRHNREVHTSSMLPLKSSKKRRRKRKIVESKSKVSDVPSSTGNNIGETVNIIQEEPFATKAFVPRTHTAAMTQSEASSEATAGTVNSSRTSSPSNKEGTVGGQTTRPKSHPDRTTWEVPSYSHKISTMMSKKKKENKTKLSETTTRTGLLRRSTEDPSPNPTSGVIGGTGLTPGKIAETATTATGTATSRSSRTMKPTTTARPLSQSTLGSSTTPWVRKFLSGRPKDRLLPLPRDYIADNFNLAQLPPIVERIGYQAMGDNAISVAKALQQQRIAAAAAGTSQTTRASSYPIYRRALQNILADPDSGEDENDEDLIIPPYAIQKASEALYVLLHARFVISPRGLEAIRHVMSLDNTVFGKCPRSTCKGTGLLPYGYSNDYTSDASVPTVTAAMRKEHDSCCHRYCPSCGEVWTSWESKTDGCAWGPSWCHLFLLAFGSQVYAEELEAAAAAAATAAANDQVPQSPQQPPQAASPSMVRSFLPRGIGTRGSLATSNSGTSATNASGSDRDDNAVEDLSRPTPSVFGFRIHPSTSFGRPFNEPSLRGGSND